MTKVGAGNNGLPIERPTNNTPPIINNNPILKAVADNTRVVISNLSNIFTPQNYKQSSSSPLHPALPAFNLAKGGAKASAGAVAQTQSNTGNQRAIGLINELKKSINDPVKFAGAVNELLKNSRDRADLIGYFGLDSAKNKNDLGRAMFLEAGEGLNKDNMMPVGAVILNRVLSNDLALAASGSKKRLGVAEIINEVGANGKNEFSIKGNFGAGGGTIGKGAEVQGMVSELLQGSAGSHGSQAATSFYFQRGELNNSTFKEGRHNFSEKPWGTDYVNGNNLVHRGRHGYH